MASLLLLLLRASPEHSLPHLALPALPPASADCQLPPHAWLRCPSSLFTRSAFPGAAPPPSAHLATPLFGVASTHAAPRLPLFSILASALHALSASSDLSLSLSLPPAPSLLCLARQLTLTCCSSSLSLSLGLLMPLTLLLASLPIFASFTHRQPPPASSPSFSLFSFSFSFFQPNPLFFFLSSLPLPRPVFLLFYFQPPPRAHPSSFSTRHLLPDTRYSLLPKTCQP